MNLLIVDDHPTNLKLLRAQLEAEGHAVFEAHDGVDALALLERQRVDGVISDILMPRMDGYRLCYEIRMNERLHDLPVIIYTSTYTSPVEERLALDMGADKYLKKPVSVETIITALHEVIAKPHAAPHAKALVEVEVLKQYNERLVSKLKEKNTELQAQTEALRLPSAALTAAANAILIANRDGTIVWVNPAFTTLTGYTLAEAVGKNSRDLVKSGQQERAVYEEIWATILAGRVWHGQLVNRRKDGSLYPEEQTITPVRDAHGEITHFIAIKQDLSERKHAEEALRASERKFQSVFEQAAAGVIIAKGPRGQFVNVNRRFCEMLGYSAEELLQLTAHDITHPDDIAKDIDQREQISFGIIREFYREKRYRRKDGSFVWAKTFVAPLDPSEAKPTLRIGVIIDITERKRAEVGLRESEERFRIAAETANDVIYEWDLKQSVQWLGKIDELLGYGPGEFPRTLDAWASSVHPEDIERTMAEIQAHLEGRALYVAEYRVRRKDGVYRWWTARGAAARTPDGKPIRLIGSITDITERKRAEESIARERHLLRTLVDVLPETFYVKDLDSRFLVVNETLAKQYGKDTPAQFLGLSDADLFPAGLAAELRAEEMKVFAGEPIISHEDSMVLLDGRLHTVLTTKLPFRDSQGRICGLVGIGQDITGRKRAAEALHHEQTLMATLMKNLPDVVYFKDAASRFLRVNPALARRFGLSDPAQAVGKTDMDFFTEEHASKALADEQEVIRTGQPLVNIEEKETWSDGSETWVLTTKLPLRDDAGRIIGTCGISSNITERKRAEEALQLSQQRLSLHVEQTPLAVIEFDLEGRVREWNPAAVAIFGFSCEEAIGQNWTFIVPAAIHGQVAGVWSAIVSQRGGNRSTNENITKDGRKIDCEWFNTPLVDPDGRTIGVASLIQDVSERKQAEKEILSVARFPDENPSPMLRVARDGQLLYANRSSQRLLEHWHCAQAGQSLPEAECGWIAETLERGDIQHQEVTCGEVVYWLELAPIPEMGYVNIYGRDITEHKRALDVLQESEARFRATFKQVAVGMSIVSLEGRFLRANQKLCDITGYSREELLALTWQRITHPDDLNADLAQARCLLAGEIQTYRMEKRYLRKNGTPVWVELTASLVRKPDGTPDYFISVIEDITNRRSLETQFRQAQKMEGIGQLAGGVAHDFNNILAVMMMQAELAGMVKNTPEEVREGLREIRVAAEHAANLTRQLLLFSRRQVIQPRQLDLNEVVTSLAKMLQHIIREDVRLQLHLHSAPLLTYADAGMLDQLLMNLAVNARDAMPKGGRLIIETAERVIDAEQAGLNPDASPGRYAWLSVSDTGCGIPPKVLPHIFEPFFTTKEAGKGTGLGLATVFGIVKQHRGWLKVYSEAGKGTTFQIFLPASDASAEALAKEAVKPKPRGGSETILLVEDETSLRTLTRTVLERQGYHVLEANNGVEAQQVWTEQQSGIALLLTDLVMPAGVDGRELAARLQIQRPGLKVIFTSGYSADIAGRELTLKAGQNFIQKPCPPDQLLEAVRNCLDS
jgi:PAS domain S-box-containing protein